MVISAHGLPATSTMLPLSEPSNCAAARGGATTASAAAAANNAARNQLLRGAIERVCDRNAVKFMCGLTAANNCSFMLGSPLSRDGYYPEVPRERCAPYYPQFEPESKLNHPSGREQLLGADVSGSANCGSAPVRNRIGYSRFLKSLEAQQTAIADAARDIVALIARPG